MLTQPDGTRILEQGTHLIFDTGAPGKAASARVQTCVGGVEVSVSNTVSFLGLFLKPEVARAMARALDRAADLADLP